MNNNQDDYKILRTQYGNLKSLYSKIQTEKRLIEEDRDELRKKVRDLEKEVEELRLQKQNFERTSALKDEKQLEDFLKYLEGSEIVNLLTNITNVSNRIRLDMLQNILQVAKENKWYFDVKIFEWANQFGFRIEGDHLIFEKGSMLEFIKMLEQKFEEWKTMEHQKI
ncbi:MAG: hypothetical protein ACFE8G_11410 [Candidatus Hermodarchaeota archaeon]